MMLRLNGVVEKWEGEKLWEYGKYLIFFFMCLVGGMKKLEGEKFFCLVGEKKRRMENVIYIN